MLTRDEERASSVLLTLAQWDALSDGERMWEKGCPFLVLDCGATHIEVRPVVLLCDGDGAPVLAGEPP